MTDDAKPGPAGPGVQDLAVSASAAPGARLRELSPTTMWLTAAVVVALTAGAVVAGDCGAQRC
jgi:hypothetical protein